MNNFVKRTITSVVYVGVMCAGLLVSPGVFGALFLVIMSVAIQEFYNMSLGGRLVLQQKTGLLAAAVTFMILFCVLQYGLEARWLLLAALPVMAVLLSFLFQKDYSDLNLSAYIYTGLLYIALPFLLDLVLVLKGGEFRGQLLLMLFVMIWFSDAGAYIIGTAFGQKPGSRKLAPSISPKKSWWGFWGGVASGILVAIALGINSFLPFPIVHRIAIGLIVSIGCVAGDLVESMWKRHFGVKDSGNCIPGHGGMLDRFDSSLVAIPAAFIYMEIFSLL